MKRGNISLVVFLACAAQIFPMQVQSNWSPIYNSCYGMIVRMQRGESYTFYFTPGSMERQYINVCPTNFRGDPDLTMFDSSGNAILRATNYMEDFIAFTPRDPYETFYFTVTVKSGQDSMRIMAGSWLDVSSAKTLYD